MRFIFTLFTVASILSGKIYALDFGVFDLKLHQQAVAYDPELSDHFYCWEIEPHFFTDYLGIYKHRPIADNSQGMRSHGTFFLWYFLKQIQPTLVIESGVYRGQSTWVIEQAVPNAKIIAIDPEPNPRIYTSKNATYYTTEDFAEIEIDIEGANGPVVCFFDDHVNAFDRIIQAHQKGIKYLIFDDNYPASNESEIYHLTLSNCFEMENYKDKKAILKNLIKCWYIMPQIIGKTSSHPVCEKIATNLPAIWEKLEDVDFDARSQMETFANDSVEYRWLSYVELF